MPRPKTYKIDENIFDKELTEETSYLLGLIFSDGHLNYDKGVFQYVCKSSDIELIHYIKNILKSSHPIKIYKIKNKEYARYGISNTRLVKSIIDKFNMPHSNKSKNNLFIPKNIKDDMISHFLRGVFDGDGSVWNSGKHLNKLDFCVSYTGGENFIKEIQNYLNKKLNINGCISYKYGKLNKNSCNISYHGNHVAQKIYEFLYKNASIYLIRKKKLMEQAAEKSKEIKSIYFKYNGKKEKIKSLYILGYNQREISTKLNLVYSSVRGCIQIMRKNDEIV